MEIPKLLRPEDIYPDRAKELYTYLEHFIHATKGYIPIWAIGQLGQEEKQEVLGQLSTIYGEYTDVSSLIDRQMYYSSSKTNKMKGIVYPPVEGGLYFPNAGGISDMRKRNRHINIQWLRCVGHYFETERQELLQEISQVELYEPGLYAQYIPKEENIGFSCDFVRLLREDDGQPADTVQLIPVSRYTARYTKIEQGKCWVEEEWPDMATYFRKLIENKGIVDSYTHDNLLGNTLHKTSPVKIELRRLDNMFFDTTPVRSHNSKWKAYTVFSVMNVERAREQRNLDWVWDMREDGVAWVILDGGVEVAWAPASTEESGALMERSIVIRPRTEAEKQEYRIIPLNRIQRDFIDLLLQAGEAGLYTGNKPFEQSLQAHIYSINREFTNQGLPPLIRWTDTVKGHYTFNTPNNN